MAFWSLFKAFGMREVFPFHIWFWFPSARDRERERKKKVTEETVWNECDLLRTHSLTHISIIIIHAQTYLHTNWFQVPACLYMCVCAINRRNSGHLFDIDILLFCTSNRKFTKSGYFPVADKYGRFHRYSISESLVSSEKLSKPKNRQSFHAHDFHIDFALVGSFCRESKIVFLAIFNAHVVSVCVFCTCTCAGAINQPSVTLYLCKYCQRS